MPAKSDLKRLMATIRKTAPSARRKAAIAAALAALLSGPATGSTSWYDSEYVQCQGTTAAIVQCLDRLTETWQGRLDRAYQALLTQQDTPERKDQLRQAQRLWAEYRQANCTFYRRGPGSIAAIEAAECMRVLTKHRALELEQTRADRPTGR